MRSSAFLRADGVHIVDGDGRQVRLRGVGLDGWLATEHGGGEHPVGEPMRRLAVDLLGAERAGVFLDRLQGTFFGLPDVDLLADLGVNCVRLPFDYRQVAPHGRGPADDTPGMRHLDRAVRLCALRGIYTVLDLRVVPGAGGQQTPGRHPDRDGRDRLAEFWRHRALQDRVVRLWEAIAERYRDEPYIAGYHLIDEPGESSGTVTRPVHDRLVAAVRAVDPHRMLFLDAHAHVATPLAEPDPVAAYANVVFACRDDPPVVTSPGHRFVPRDRLEHAFLRRSTHPRRTGTPVWVDGLCPTRTGDAARDEDGYRILADQLEIYDEHGASWSIRTYKDAGPRGLVYPNPAQPGLRRADILAALARGGAGEATQRFPGLHDDALYALADAFALDHCVRRDRLATLLARHTVTTVPVRRVR